MNPSLDQLLASVRTRLQETIIPALPAEEEFAREQATFVLHALDLVRAVQDHAYRYEVVEYHAYRDAMIELLELAPGETDVPSGQHLQQLLTSPQPRADEARLPLATLQNLTRTMRDLVLELAEQLLTKPELAEQTQSVVLAVARTQVAREAAWLAPTQYVDSDRTLAEALETLGP